MVGYLLTAEQRDKARKKKSIFIANGPAKRHTDKTDRHVHFQQHRAITLSVLGVTGLRERGGKIVSLSLSVCLSK